MNTDALPAPKKLPLLIGMGEEAERAAKKIMEGCSLLEALKALACAGKVEITFKRPVSLYRSRKISSLSDPKKKHIFSGFGSNNGNILYLFRKNGRGGYYLPVEQIERYEPVLNSGKEFKDFESFRKKFDTRFISETLIKNLWEGRSAQHGERYNRKDFKRLGPQAKRILPGFLRLFKGIDDTVGEGYTDRPATDYYKAYKILSVRHHTYGNGNSGRDITISHQLGLDRVFYSSEYPGCANGDYGLLVSEKEWLYLERD